MTYLTSKYPTEWREEHPVQAASLIQHYENEWANCSQACARMQTERNELVSHVERINTILFDTFSGIEDGEYGRIYDALVRGDLPMPSQGAKR